MDKIYIQCGYEDKCKNKECLKCPRRKRHNLSLTLAEEIVIEDFATCDLEEMMKTKPEVLELMQRVCFKIMKKIFKEEKVEDGR